jgi:hypothetical protein
MGRVALHADGHAETGDGIYWAELSMSPSDTFVLLWRDATDDDSTIGYRTGGLGRYRLIEKGVGLRCDGRLERPNDGHVANNGAFIIADWLFTDELRSRLHIFSAEGESLVRRANRANVLATYMEPDGRYAAAHLAATPDDDRDDERFILFDVTSRSEVWSKALEIGRPDQVAFDVAGGALWLENQPFGRVRYGLTDSSVDANELRERLLAGADGFAILALIEGEVGAGVPPDRREHLVDACLRAADRLTSYPRHAARALRIAGEIVEPYAPARTIDYWDRALGLDPHVGVAKRAQSLRAARR